MSPKRRRKERPVLGKGMPQIIARIRLPFGANREQWGAAIDQELIKVWIKMSNVKSAQARALYRVITGKARRKVVSLPSQRDMVILDEIIVAQAVTLGWRLTTSQLVLFRFSQWSVEPFHPELFERLGKALARSVCILARDELPPIDDPGLREHKRLAVPELRMLLREMRTIFLGRSSSPNAKELTDWFLKALVDSERFPTLTRNLLHWGVFLTAQENSGSLELQLTRRLEPAALFDSWLASLKGHNAEYLRKSLTRLSSSK
jgi:hypothetical protein